MEQLEAIKFSNSTNDQIPNPTDNLPEDLPYTQTDPEEEYLILLNEEWARRNDQEDAHE